MTFLGTVFVVLLVLKLTNLIVWSWWWVLAPIWVPIAFSILRAIKRSMDSWWDDLY